MVETGATVPGYSGGVAAAWPFRIRVLGAAAYGGLIQTVAACAVRLEWLFVS